MERDAMRTFDVPTAKRAHLVALEGALDIDSLWRASVNLFRQSLPRRSCALYTDIIELKPGRMRYNVVAPRKADYAPAKSLSVSGPYLARHPRLTSCTYAEIAAADPAAPYRRLEQEPDPEWSDFVALAFWNKAGPHSVLAVFGPDPVPQEERFFLECLHPTIDAGLRRLRALEDERKMSLLLQGFLQNSPEAVAFFDARGRILYQNRHGEALICRWSRCLDAGREPQWIPAMMQASISDLTWPHHIKHPSLPELSAVLERSPNGFVLRITDRRSGVPAVELSAGAMATLKLLSKSEQRVARLVVEGLRNEQIANQLCRSTRTVECQLRSIFQKLDIASRVQLVRLLA